MLRMRWVRLQQLIIMASAGSLQEKELETKVVSKCLDKLSEYLDIDRVLDKLLSKELISAEKHSEIAKLVVDGKRRQAVRNAMEEMGLKPPGFLNSFIEVLREDEKTKYLGDYVAKEYQKVTDNVPAQMTVDETDYVPSKVSWKPFDLATAHLLLRPIAADWEELAVCLLKDKADEKIKLINADCFNNNTANKALNKTIMAWICRTTRDKRTWKTLCEVAGKWGDMTLEQYLKVNHLARDQEPQPDHVMKWCKQSSLRSEWYGFSIQLLGKNEADAIKCNLGGGGNKECLEKLLGIWYNSTITHNWVIIVDALDEMLADKRVIDRIKSKCAA